jgi:hypothetical protein
LSDRTNALEFDSNGGFLYAGGDYTEFICFPGWCSGTVNNNDDGFVLKFNTGLNAEWGYNTFVSGEARITSITVDETNGVYFAGGIKGFLETDTKAITTQGDFDALTGRLENDGNWYFVDFIDGFGGTGDDAVFGLDVAAEKIQMSGSYFGAMDIPGVGRLISTGNRDVMVATASTDRVPPSIDEIIAPQFYTSGSNEVASVVVSDNRAIQVVNVHYKLFTEPESTARTIVEADFSGNHTNWTFPLATLSTDPLGGDYFFEVIDIDGNKVTSELQDTWIRYDGGVTLTVPQVGTASEDFRLVSISITSKK